MTGRGNARLAVVIGIILTLALIHVIPIPQHDVRVEGQVPYGSYGLAFSTLPPKKAKRVILLGNSVFYGTAVVPFLEKLERISPLDFEIANFAITGSSIADYILAYEYIKKFQPDLVLIHSAPITYGYDWPLFRTDAKYLILMPEMKRLRRTSFLKLYSRNDLAKALIYRLLPVARAHDVYKISLKNAINGRLEDLGGIRIMDFFRYSFNTALDWMIAANIRAVADHQVTEYPQSRMLLEMFLEFLHEDRQRAVFVEQESDYSELAITRDMEGFFEGHRYARYYDHRSFYDPEKYEDVVHPKRDEAFAAAARLFQIIEENLGQP